MINLSLTRQQLVLLFLGVTFVPVLLFASGFFSGTAASVHAFKVMSATMGVAPDRGEHKAGTGATPSLANNAPAIAPSARLPAEAAPDSGQRETVGFQAIGANRSSIADEASAGIAWLLPVSEDPEPAQAQPIEQWVNKSGANGSAEPGATHGSPDDLAASLSIDDATAPDLADLMIESDNGSLGNAPEYNDSIKQAPDILVFQKIDAINHSVQSAEEKPLIAASEADTETVSIEEAAVESMTGEAVSGATPGNTAAGEAIAIETATGKAAPDEDRLHSIQVGSFSKLSNATGITGLLKDKGYDSRTEVVSVSGDKSVSRYNVQIGLYDSLSDAVEALRHYQKAEKAPAFIVSIPADQG